MTTRTDVMQLRANHHGFLIPDRALANMEEALSGIDANLAKIVRLLEGAHRARTVYAPQQTTAQRMRSSALPAIASLAQPLSANTRASSAQRSAPRSAQSRQAEFAPSLPPNIAPALQQALSQRQTAQRTKKQPATRDENTPATTATRSARQVTASSRLASSAAPARDQRGRFVAKDGVAADAHTGDGAHSNAATALALTARVSDALGKLAQLPALAGDVSQLDPGMDALMEIKGAMAGPLALLGKTGSAMLNRRAQKRSAAQESEVKTGAEAHTASWRQRLLKTLNLTRKEASAFHRASQRAQTAQAKANSGAPESGMLMSAIKMVFSPIGAMAASALGALLMSAREQIGAALQTGINSMNAAWNRSADQLSQWIKGKRDQLADFGAGVKDKLGQAVQAGKNMAAPVLSGVKTAAQAANAGIKSATGVDIQAGAQTLHNRMSEKMNNQVLRAQAAGGSLLEKVLPKGYRHKAMFDGIAGGAGLSKNGSYTDDEAQRIRDLKTSAANTSAHLPGGMPADIQQKIIQQAKAAGLPPDMMLQIAAMESGGNANAISPTGAIGIYQFTGQTASGVGIKNRFDVDQNIAGGMKLTQQNMRMLQDAKLPVSAENLYMMHQLGPVAAPEIIRGAQTGASIASLSPATQKAVALNYGATAKTAQEYLKANQAALIKRAQSEIGKSSAGFLPTGDTNQALTAPTAGKGVTPAAAPSTRTMPPSTAATATPVSAVSPASMLTVAPSLAAATHIQSSAAVKPPTPAAPPPAPPVETASRLNHASPLEVIVRNEQAVAQDVPDRRLAAIASGGLSQM